MKRGDAEALGLLGYGRKASVSIEGVRFDPARVAIGERVEVAFTLRSTSRAPQELLVDLAVHFVKANGRARPKVFKLARVSLPPRGRVEIAHQGVAGRPHDAPAPPRHPRGRRRRERDGDAHRLVRGGGGPRDSGPGRILEVRSEEGPASARQEPRGQGRGRGPRPGDPPSRRAARRSPSRRARRPPRWFPRPPRRSSRRRSSSCSRRPGSRPPSRGRCSPDPRSGGPVGPGLGPAEMGMEHHLCAMARGPADGLRVAPALVADDHAEGEGPHPEDPPLGTRVKSPSSEGSSCTLSCQPRVAPSGRRPGP